MSSAESVPLRVVTDSNAQPLQGSNVTSGTSAIQSVEGRSKDGDDITAAGLVGSGRDGICDSGDEYGVSGNGGGVGMASSLATSVSDGNDIGVRAQTNILAVVRYASGGMESARARCSSSSSLSSPSSSSSSSASSLEDYSSSSSSSLLVGLSAGSSS
nr:hypothetical protein [Tanacetum cinerariifolium]